MTAKDASNQEQPVYNNHNPNIEANFQFVPCNIIPELPIFSGEFRINEDGGALPSNIGIRAKGTTITVLDEKNSFSFPFACCFHTSESQDEILKLLLEINTKLLTHNVFDVKEGVSPAFTGKLINNLANLHALLPGEPHQKSAKIYWNEQAEEILLPLLFKNGNVDFNDLVFALTPGGEGISQFQADEMDFTNQLQFVGIGKKNILENLKKEIEQISNEIFSKSILEELENGLPEKPNRLMSDAASFTLRYNLKSNLLNLRAQNKKIDFDGMSPEDKNNLIEGN